MDYPTTVLLKQIKEEIISTITMPASEAASLLAPNANGTYIYMYICEYISIKVYISFVFYLCSFFWGMYICLLVGKHVCIYEYV